jgi:hypothetical protein
MQANITVGTFRILEPQPLFFFFVNMPFMDVLRLILATVYEYLEFFYYLRIAHTF